LTPSLEYYHWMRFIEARYEEGLLKPETPLALTPGERVALIVVRHPDPRRWNLERLATGGVEEDLSLAEQGLAEWADDLDQEDHR
jgi:predicted DNA-binding antitoxin AbrB/MazE fold protein